MLLQKWKNRGVILKVENKILSDLILRIQDKKQDESINWEETTFKSIIAKYDEELS